MEVTLPNVRSKKNNKTGRIKVSIKTEISFAFMISIGIYLGDLEK